MLTCANVTSSGEIGKAPVICVWDSHTLETLSVLKGVHGHGIAALNFGSSPRNKLLVSVGTDPKHTIVVWDWVKGLPMAHVNGHGDVVADVQFSPYEANRIVSCGAKHIKFWTLSGNTLSVRLHYKKNYTQIPNDWIPLFEGY